MPDVPSLDAGENAKRHACARLFDLRTGAEIFLPFLDTYMREVQANDQPSKPNRVEQTTVYVLVMQHVGDLPEGFADELANRAYTAAAAKGILMKGSEVRVGAQLPLREMTK